MERESYNGRAPCQRVFYITPMKKKVNGCYAMEVKEEKGEKRGDREEHMEEKGEKSVA